MWPEIFAQEHQIIANFYSIPLFKREKCHFVSVMMGTYFYLDETNNDAVDNLRWIPLLALVIFISFFSIGNGPVPNVMMSK